MCSSLRVIFLLLQTRGVWCVRRGLGRHQDLTPSPRPPSQGGHGDPRQLPGLCWSWGGHLWVPDLHRPGLPELQPTAQMAGGCWDPSSPLPQVWAVLLLTGQCAFRPSVVPSGVFSSPSPRPPSVPGEGKGLVKSPSCVCWQGAFPDQCAALHSLPPTLHTSRTLVCSRRTAASSADLFLHCKAMGPVAWMQGGKGCLQPIASAQQGQAGAGQQALRRPGCVAQQLCPAGFLQVGHTPP